MDVVKWLETLLGDCRLVGSAEEALSLVPSLAMDAPVMLDLQVEGEKTTWRGCPVGFARALQAPVGFMVAESMSQVVAGQEPTDPAGVDLGVLAQDPATAKLARLLAEAWRFGPRGTSLVMLEAIRETALIAAGQLDELNRVSATAGSRARKALDELPDRVPARIEYYNGLAWSLSLRLGGAWALAGVLDPAIQPTRLYQALVANRLALVLPAGGLDPAEDLDLVAGVLGIQVEPGILGAAQRAIAAGLKVALAGKGGVAGAGLRDLAGIRTDLLTLSMDPRIAALALHSLPDLVDLKELRAAGVARGAQKNLLKRAGAAATAALYASAVRAVRTWELLAALAGRCLPVEREGAIWQSRLGRMAGEFPWCVLSPRGDGGQVRLSVVGVNLDGLWETVRALVQDQGDVTLLLAARSIWTGLAEGAAGLGGMARQVGANGIGLFTTSKAAESWAESVRSAYRPPLRLETHPFGDGMQVPSGGGVSVQVAPGPLLAAYDGVQLWATGKAVVEAMGTAGIGLGGSLPEATDDDLIGLGLPDAGAPDPFGIEQPPPAAAAPDDPFALAAPPAEPEEEDPGFGLFDREVPEIEMPDPGPPQGDAPGLGGHEGSGEPDGDDRGAEDPELYMLPPPTDDELAANEDPVEGTFMLPPPSEAELEDLRQREQPGADTGTAYDIEVSDEDSDVASDVPGPAAAADDPFGAFDAEDSDEDSEADFEPMGAGEGFKLADEGTQEKMQAEETFRFETPLFDGEPATEKNAGFDLKKAEESAPSAGREAEDEADPWDNVGPRDEDAEAAGGDLFEDPSELDDSEAPAPTMPLGLGMADLRYLFEGYVHFLDGSASIVFGRRYGERVLDRHVYEFQGDLVAVYRSFLMDKVDEGFVPRTDLVGDLPSGVTPEAIDLNRMGAVASGGG